MEPRGPRVLVQAVLDMGTRHQVVLVQRVRTGVGVGPAEEDVNGAEVVIITPEGHEMRGVQDTSTTPVDDPYSDGSVIDRRRGTYYIHLDDHGVTLQPGGIYSLRVRTPDGIEVTGTTRIPHATSSVTEIRDSFDLRDTLRLSWLPVGGARSYLVHIHWQFRYYSYRQSSSYSVFAFPPYSIPGNARTFLDEPVFSSGPNTVTVAAVDTNYYDYFRVQADPFAGAPKTRLAGGEGVFGSIVPISIWTLNARVLGPGAPPVH